MKQVTFNSYPVYTFIGDRGLKQANGEGIMALGGTWLLQHASSSTLGGTSVHDADDAHYDDDDVDTHHDVDAHHDDNDAHHDDDGADNNDAHNGQWRGRLYLLTVSTPRSIEARHSGQPLPSHASTATASQIKCVGLFQDRRGFTNTWCAGRDLNPEPVD